MKRDTKIVNLYKKGHTLREIGNIYSLSKERIRQILAAKGLSKKDGGISIKHKKAKIISETTKEQRMQERYGCSVETYKTAFGTPDERRIKIEAFIHQRKNAKYRGIKWDLCFFDWWEKWKDKWEQRGRNYGQYVMGRTGDIGPYSAENVRIMTNTENIIEYCTKVHGGDYSGTVDDAIMDADLMRMDGLEPGLYQGQQINVEFQRILEEFNGNSGLAKHLGTTPNNIVQMKRRGYMSVNLAKKAEELSGGKYTAKLLAKRGEIQ